MMKKLTIAAALAAALATTAFAPAPAEAGWKRHKFGHFKIFIKRYDHCYWKWVKVYDDYYGWTKIKIKVCDY